MQKSGLRIVLASSASGRELDVLRAALDADDVIDDATSSADVQRTKPAPDLVQVALDKAGARPADAVFVGDSVWDVRACCQAGVACIAVLCGGTGRDELVEAGASEIYRDPADLLAALPGSLLGGSRPAS